MVSYHARRLKALYGDGWYIVKKEDGKETLMEQYFSGDFRESEYEATALAHYLTERATQRGPCIVKDNRMRRRVNE